jgi:hypothetical protein
MGFVFIRDIDIDIDVDVDVDYTTWQSKLLVIRVYSCLQIIKYRWPIYLKGRSILKV